MSFNTALSGLNAASNLLSTTGNNISNANTTGFKQSRSEFADLYASTFGGVSNTTPGAGVRVADVAQQFNQGNLDFTNNNLDLAISGEGMFVLGKTPTSTTDRSYTRSGAFHSDQDGYVVNNLGQPLLAYKPNGTAVKDGFSTGVLQPIKIDASQGLPKATSTVNLNANLDARNTAPAGAFNATDSTTYNSSTSMTVYDSLGNSHTVTAYYIATGTANQWNMQVYVDGTDMLGGTPVSVEFDTNGQLTKVNGAAGTTFTTGAVSVNPGAADITLAFDLAGSTQLGSAFSVSTMSQNGLPIGRLTGVDIDDTGVVFARYSNGASITLGQVALARFQNNQGLSKLGDTEWAESTDSGVPITGQAGTSSFGSIKAGALEGSNVDLSQQLVTLIVAQQAYQANAQAISTENQVTQTLLNIR